MRSSSQQSTAISDRPSFVYDLPRLTLLLSLLLTFAHAHAYPPYTYEDENVFHGESPSGRRIFGTPPIARGHPGTRETRCPSVAANDGAAPVANRFDEVGSGTSGTSFSQQHRQQQQSFRSAPPPPAFSGRRIFPPAEDEAPALRFGPSPVGGRRIFPDNPTEGDDRPRRKMDTSKSFFDPAKNSLSASLRNAMPDESWADNAYEDISDESDESSDISVPTYRIYFKDDYDDASLEDYPDDYPQARYRMFP